MYDFTPDDRKVFARTAQVRKGEVYVSVTETDRDDLSRVSLYVLVERGRRGLGEQTELSLTVSARVLDDLIETLTLARDTAITEWMLEPALSPEKAEWRGVFRRVSG